MAEVRRASKPRTRRAAARGIRPTSQRSAVGLVPGSGGVLESCYVSMPEGAPVMRILAPGLLALLAFSILPRTVSAVSASLPIQLDGAFDDWSGNPAEVSDPLGDAGGSGIDFARVALANDEVRLYLRFDTTIEVQPDEGHDIRFALDTDDDAATGFPVGGIGAELVWSLGLRSGTFYLGGGSSAASHPQLGLGIAPTVSGTEFEVAVLRSATSGGGQPLFTGSPIRVLVYDNSGSGDQAGSSLLYEFDATPQPVPSISLARNAASNVRVAGYNIENDGLFDTNPARRAALERILQAVDADVWILTEVWDHDSTDVRLRFEEIFPSSPGSAWKAYKPHSGTVVVSRLPVLDAAAFVVPSRYHVALLVDARPLLDSDLLVVGNHWSCCTADANRQDQADGLIQNLKSAREAGGELELAPGTPIVAGGDFNLVGLRRQLETLLTGDIADEGSWGADSPPDWDGSDFEVVPARHPDARLFHTWRNDGSSFYPGRLDWLVYTASAMDVQNHFVLDTRSMTAANLAAHGLNAGDTGLASDHGPIVADFSSPQPVAVEPIPALPSRLTLEAATPNPFDGTTRIRFFLPQAATVQVRLYDARGSLVRTLMDRREVPAGRHEVPWDGKTADGTAAGAGVYFFEVLAAGERAAGRLVLIR